MLFEECSFSLTSFCNEVNGSEITKHTTYFSHVVADECFLSRKWWIMFLYLKLFSTTDIYQHLSTAHHISRKYRSMNIRNYNVDINSKYIHNWARILHFLKYRNFSQFFNLAILWKLTISTKFSHQKIRSN